MSELLELLSYPFVVRALVVGVLVSLCAALLGVSLVLRRYSMIGDGLSHVGFGALAIAAALNIAPLRVTILIVIIAAFFLLRLTQNHKVKGDSAIAIISTGSLALGVMVISLTEGMNTDLNSYLFGSILATNKEDMVLSIIFSVIVISLFLFFYNKIFALTFDEEFAKATGMNVELFNMLIAVLTAITIVIGMRIMGSMLISALIIFPAITSMRLFKTFKLVTISTVFLAVVGFLVGFFISCIYSTPTGASVVVVNIVFLILFSLISVFKKVKR